MLFSSICNYVSTFASKISALSVIFTIANFVFQIH